MNLIHKNKALNVFINFWKIINNKRKNDIKIYFLMSILNGISEIVSLSLVIPFITIIVNSEDVTKNNLFLKYFYFKDILSLNQLIIINSILIVLIIIFAMIIRLVNLKLGNIISARIGVDLSTICYKKNINEDFLFFKYHNTSDLISTNTFRIEQTMAAVVSVFNLMTSLIISFAIFITLLIINFSATIIIFLLVVSCYLIINIYSKKKYKINSEIISRESSKQIKILQESYGSIGDIILNNSHKFFIKIFNKIENNLRFKTAENSYLATFPKYPIELLGIIILISLGIILKLNQYESSYILTTVGAFAFGAQKLLPAIQSIYYCLSSINSRIDDLEKVNQTIQKITSGRENITRDKKFFRDHIKLSKVNYKYQNSKDFVLKNINLEIKKGERIGIVGKTGSGKSTLINILMGLIKPTSGKLIVDEKDINSKESLILKWRAEISNVPQQLFLLDDNFTNNIAFGISEKDINNTKIKSVAKRAKIHDFISKTERKYATLIGERGSNLSGGQIQRIAIARALYKDSNIIFFDEATSALDADTERMIMEEIENLDRSITMIIISHKLSTIKKCDRVFELSKNNLQQIII